MDGFELIDTVKFSVNHSNVLGIYQFSACEVNWILNLDPENFVGLVPASDLNNDILVEMIVEGHKQLHSGSYGHFGNAIGVSLMKTRRYLYRVTDTEEHRFYRDNLYGMKIEIRFYEK